jgi:hypothetical protein
MKLEAKIRRVQMSDLDSTAIFCSYNSGHDYVNKHIDKEMTINLANNRSGKMHRKAFAIAKFCSYHAPEISPWSGKDPYLFIKAVELEHGFVEPCMDLEGKITFIPASISFTNMSQNDFNKLFQALVTETSKITLIEEDDILENYREFM